MPAFGWRRWTPGLGSFRDTYGAYRTALLRGIDTVDAAVTAYHQLCPDGSLRVAAALRARHVKQAHHATAADATAWSGNGKAARVPIDLMRRIPVNSDAYQRWLTVWADLQAGDADLNDVAARHSFSRRQVEWVRQAGQFGLLDSPIPPALRLAHVASNANTPDAATPDAAAHP